MKTVSALKQDLEFNGGLAALIGVLKNIAVAQYHSMESRAKSFEKLKDAIYSFLEIIDPRQVAHPFLNPQNEVQMVVAITSDSGLLGGFEQGSDRYRPGGISEDPRAAGRHRRKREDVRP